VYGAGIRRHCSQTQPAKKETSKKKDFLYRGERGSERGLPAAIEENEKREIPRRGARRQAAAAGLHGQRSRGSRRRCAEIEAQHVEIKVAKWQTGRYQNFPPHQIGQCSTHGAHTEIAWSRMPLQ